MDETVVKQHGQEFILFAAVDPETRHLLHAAVAPIVVTDEASYGPVFTQTGIMQIIRGHSLRNHIERWIQELKRRIDAFYASFTGHAS